MEILVERFDECFDLLWNMIDNYIYVKDTIVNIKKSV
jgi:hypothetical protein